MTENYQTVPLDSVDALSAELWRERNLLEGLLYKFTTLKLLVTNGESQWVGRCNAEIENIKNQLTATQLNIDMLSVSVAAEWGLTAETAPTLRELIAGSAERGGPWPGILQDHHDALTDLTEKIRDITAVNQRLLKAASISIQDAGQQSGPVAYNASGGAARPTGLGGSLLDRSS